MLVLQYMNHFE